MDDQLQGTGKFRPGCPRDLVGTAVRGVDDLLGAHLGLDAVVPGLGDAGAHVGQICDADATTFVLSYWARDRGRFTLPEAVRKLTSQSADILGLRDRGRLEPGAFADAVRTGLRELGSSQLTEIEVERLVAGEIDLDRRD